MNSALKDIIEALLAGIVAGLILLTLMISLFNYNDNKSLMLQEPKPTQKLINEIDVNTFNKVPHTADQIDKPVDIDKIKSPDESLEIETKLP